MTDLPRARVVHDLRAALDAAPDIAVIATPSHLHAEQLMALLGAGIPCYVEKPVVADMDQARALEDFLRFLPTLAPTQTGCNLRFLPSLDRLRSMIRGGTLGHVVRATLEVGQWLPDWRPSQDYRSSYSAHAGQGGGVILDLVHELDQARWLFGEFDRVHAVAGHFSSLDIDAEDTACILLGRDTGPPAVSIGLDYVSRQRVRRYSIVGESATAVWDLASQRLDLMRPDANETVDCGERAFDISHTYVRAMESFMESVTVGRAGPQDVVDGLRSTKLALSAKAAART